MKYIIRLTLCSILLHIGTSYAEEDPRYTAFSEYVRELVKMQDLQDLASKELKKSGNSSNDQMASVIRNSTRAKLALGLNITTLKAITLPAPFEWLIPNVISIYQDKIALHDDLIQIASEFMAGPKPGVDYGKLAAEMPKITANMEFIDESLYKATPAFCLILVDKKLDRAGHLSHLIITRAQRKQFVDRIDTAFGERLRDKNPGYIVGSAVLIKDFLQGNHKSSDDPW